MLMSDASKFGKFARLLGALLSSGTGLSMPTPRRRSASVPTGKALRNPADPFQAERIERAAAKRLRKASTLQANTYTSLIRNNAHAERGHPQGGYVKSLNPLFVNR